jgi:hypothetical protein
MNALSRLLLRYSSPLVIRQRRGAPDYLGIQTTDRNPIVQITYKKSSINAKLKLLKAEILYLTLFNNNNNNNIL